MLREKLAQSTAFDQFAILHVANQVCTQHGGETVGDNDRGHTLSNVLQGIPYQGLRMTVQRAGGFIQKEDFGFPS